MIMKRRTLILSLTSLVLLLASAVMVAMTLGWIAPLVTFPDNEIAVGDLRYTISGGFVASSTIIVPGEELLESTISIDNSSPIASQMRVKIEYTAWTNDEGDIVQSNEIYHGNALEHLHATFVTGFEIVDDYWYLNGIDYQYEIGSGPQDILLSIYYDGTQTGIDYSARFVTVTVSVEVKQADHVAWSELTTYDFSTGYPV